ncbi:putative nucleotide-binding alpha-beta plait domain-containing protein [Rosa chinensis]|uniref:Putative nucleotide-binding alpha-beta plait domain-containing protein n=1 Tax=Rosa chinensis TaxID=74649 RepID=A0A2P6PRL9_ROSCH|nr:putative nucleotide-binding alpha-beta plait domain-containing protein [Rosa chinensis]
MSLSLSLSSTTNPPCSSQNCRPRIFKGLRRERKRRPRWIWIGGISWETSEDNLKEYFSNYGDIVWLYCCSDIMYVQSSSIWTKFTPSCSLNLPCIRYELV